MAKSIAILSINILEVIFIFTMSLIFLGLAKSIAILSINILKVIFIFTMSIIAFGGVALSFGFNSSFVKAKALEWGDWSDSRFKGMIMISVENTQKKKLRLLM